MTRLGDILDFWRRSLADGSRAYWVVQSIIVLLSVVLYMGMMGVMKGDIPVTDSTFRTFLRGLIEALQFLLLTHLLLRPVLRYGFVNRQARWHDWTALLVWLYLISMLTVVLTFTVEQLGISKASNIQSIRYQVVEGSMEFDVVLQGWRLYLIASINYLSMYVLWVICYLAWKSLEQRRRLQEEMREAHMQQLTHQLSPHFLFNAFNTIRGMIFEDQQRAADLVTRLSELFRFHLHRDARTEHTLADDWALAQSYLALEAVRLESRLILDVRLDRECLQRRLPSLTLLTLVENAIKHGIAPRPEGGQLSIRAAPTRRGWSLQVENPLPTVAVKGGTGTGLANLRERLKLGFGERAELIIEHPPERFVIRLEMPA